MLFEWLGDAIAFNEALNRHRSGVEPTDRLLNTLEYSVRRSSRVEPIEAVTLGGLDERWG